MVTLFQRRMMFLLYMFLFQCVKHNENGKYKTSKFLPFFSLPYPLIWYSTGDENNSVHIKLEEEGNGSLVSHMCH